MTIPDDFTGFIAYYQDEYMVIVEVNNGVYTERARTWVGDQSKIMCIPTKEGTEALLTWRGE